MTNVGAGMALGIRVYTVFQSDFHATGHLATYGSMFRTQVLKIVRQFM